jgi:flagellar biosynthesis protein FliP
VKRLLALFLLVCLLPGAEAVPDVGVVGNPAGPAAGVAGVAGPVEGVAPAAPITIDLPGPVNGVTPNPGQMRLTLDAGAGNGFSNAVSLLLLITVLAIAPAFLMMMTCFTRVIIVLGFVRRALGTQTLPPNQVVVGLALFLSLFIMAPTIKRVEAEAWTPLQKQEITQEQALTSAKQAVKDFMLKHTRKNDLALFIRLAKEERPKSGADVSFLTLVPAFMTSELKTAFQMGFVIFLPFLVIDLVISAILMSLGMMMLPPVTISLPFKILLFVLVDGWTLIVQGLAASYA